MTGQLQALKGDRIGLALLGLAGLFAVIYLFDDFGLAAPFPLNVIIKAAGIVLLGVFAAYKGKPVLALGLLLGSLGDVFLALGPEVLPYGIAAFGLGHLVYIYLFARIRIEKGSRGLWSRTAALAVAAYGIVMLSWLQPYFGEMQVAASIYNGIILVMAILAILGRAPALAAVGALFFVLSDSVLAIRLFAGQLDWAGWVVWVTYVLGQAGICLGLALPESQESAPE